ncbi:hypothetical protein [Fluviispira vulneris]|uniref:hypothetical protein n=1 Tax=Fluviispira vulneris TaxID=2763012 RepID=UPI001645278D|nr:hypothetical protein [Fluviispira vulneris]
MKFKSAISISYFISIFNSAYAQSEVSVEIDENKMICKLNSSDEDIEEKNKSYQWMISSNKEKDGYYSKYPSHKLLENQNTLQTVTINPKEERGKYEWVKCQVEIENKKNGEKLFVTSKPAKIEKVENEIFSRFFGPEWEDNLFIINKKLYKIFDNYYSVKIHRDMERITYIKPIELKDKIIKVFTMNDFCTSLQLKNGELAFNNFYYSLEQKDNIENIFTTKYGYFILYKNGELKDIFGKELMPNLRIKKFFTPYEDSTISREERRHLKLLYRILDYTYFFKDNTGDIYGFGSNYNNEISSSLPKEEIFLPAKTELPSNIDIIKTPRSRYSFYAFGSSNSLYIWDQYVREFPRTFDHSIKYFYSRYHGSRQAPAKIFAALDDNSLWVWDLIPRTDKYTTEDNEFKLPSSVKNVSVSFQDNTAHCYLLLENGEVYACNYSIHNEYNNNGKIEKIDFPKKIINIIDNEDRSDTRYFIQEDGNIYIKSPNNTIKSDITTEKISKIETIDDLTMSLSIKGKVILYDFSKNSLENLITPEEITDIKSINSDFTKAFLLFSKGDSIYYYNAEAELVNKKKEIKKIGEFKGNYAITN